MEENEVHSDIPKLALIVDGLEAIYGKDKIHIVIELGSDKYKKLYNEFVGEHFDGDMKDQFGFDISNVKFVYLLSE